MLVVHALKVQLRYMLLKKINTVYIVGVGLMPVAHALKALIKYMY